MSENEGKPFDVKAWMESQVEVFDSYKLYKEKISPLVHALRAACVEHNLPVVITICHGNDHEGETLAQLNYTPAKRTGPAMFCTWQAHRADIHQMTYAIASKKAHTMANPPTQN